MYLNIYIYIYIHIYICIPSLTSFFLTAFFLTAFFLTNFFLTKSFFPTIVVLCQKFNLIAEFHPKKSRNGKQIVLNEDYETNVTTRMYMLNMFVVLMSEFRNHVVKIIPVQSDVEGNPNQINQPLSARSYLSCNLEVRKSFMVK
jgi:hypothetical protein